jgi:TRAP-type C4-dicarboxylate transport system permease small subunit
MSSFERAVSGLSRFLDKIAGWCLVAMMLLTVADVILRLFRRPILGTYEIVGLLGALVVAFAMPHTTLQGGHVSVEIVVSRLSPSVQSIVNLVTRTLSIILFALIAWECFNYGNDLKAAGEVSMTLCLPFYPVLYGIALAAVVVCLVVGGGTLRSIARTIREWTVGLSAD